jgi:hypothetical protein
LMWWCTLISPSSGPTCMRRSSSHSNHTQAQKLDWHLYLAASGRSVRIETRSYPE